MTHTYWCGPNPRYLWHTRWYKEVWFLIANYIIQVEVQKYLTDWGCDTQNGWLSHIHLEIPTLHAQIPETKTVSGPFARLGPAGLRRFLSNTWGKHGQKSTKVDPQILANQYGDVFKASEDHHHFDLRTDTFFFMNHPDISDEFAPAVSVWPGFRTAGHPCRCGTGRYKLICWKRWNRHAMNLYKQCLLAVLANMNMG